MTNNTGSLGAVDAAMALTFSLDGETFAVPVQHVREIIDPLPITDVPNADQVAPGLVNVRGAIAPFIDLRHRLGMRPAVLRETSRILVLELTLEGEMTTVAMLADDVDDITETTSADLETVPDLGVRWPTEFIKGVAKKDGALVILLDVQTAFAPKPSH
ncbi:Coupling protein CheW [Jannaschia seosinensis]|uniref:Coupling protein CheW n=1 Tax=Jannaschia seosinensis TaxID=313367 RepID=A0A0M7BAQ6_9RHOB|nr:chemotaxis protein CheW [Jannaschia seosinensis]CUH39820.1 Coupling protein CheW [Jannaschia seosinensis]